MLKSSIGNHMNKQTEIIINKMTDHFGLWEAKKEKEEKCKPKKLVSKSDTKKIKHVQKVESESDKARKEEIQFIKEQIIRCSKSYDSEIQIIQTQSTKNRQAELVYAKEILACEVSIQPMTFAS